MADSTNERAKELARAGAPHGTTVTAGEQTAGRGRQGRAWVARPGTALLVSVVVRDLGERLPLLPLAAAVGTCDAAEQVAPVRCRIKWPNDVWVDGRKLAGILVEGRPVEGWAVLGIGLNVLTDRFPPELRDIATSLAVAAPGAGVSVEAALDALLNALDRWVGEEPAAVLEAWRARDALRDRHVRWEGGEGTAAGIDDGGSLLVETSEGVVALQAGEVHLRRD